MLNGKTAIVTGLKIGPTARIAERHNELGLR